MKTLKLTSALLAFTLAFTACKKDKDSSISQIQGTRDFLQEVGPKIQTHKFNSNQDYTITLKGGTVLAFKAGSFTKNGQTVVGEVTLNTYEMLKRSDVLFSGTNTNHISGAPLTSQGFIFIDAKVNGVTVDQYLAEPVKISIPAENNGYTEIWQGALNENNQFAWEDPIAANGEPIRQQLKADNQSGNSNFIFSFGKLGWINCDVFYNMSNPKTTVKVTVGNNPGSMANFMAGNGETFVYFCAKGQNVAAQLYNEVAVNTVASYDNSMPVGSLGKFISFSIKNGKFYFAEQEVTITNNLHLTLNLTETTQIAIQTALDNLNNY